MSSTRVTRPLAASPPPAAADGPKVVRAASRGFTVFLLGGVVQPLVGALYAPLGMGWLVLVAVAACVTAAWGARGSAAPVEHGVLAALGSYLLVVPVVYIATQQIDPVQIGSTAALAVAVGAATGWLRGRVRPQVRN